MAVRNPASRGHKHGASNLLSDTLTAGDVLYVNNSGELALLPIGSASQVLTVSSGLPAWVTGAAGVSAFNDLSDVDLTGAANNDLLFRSAGSWIDTAGLLTWDGNILTVKDALGTDSVAFSHDGTDFNANFVTTASWNLTNLTNLDLHDACVLRIWDSTDTDSAQFQHDGTDFNTTFSTTTDWNISGLTGDIKLVNAIDLDFLGGGRLIVRDTGGTDYVIQRHDGTDFHFDFTNTGTVLFENATSDFFVLDFTNDRWIAYAPMFMQEQAAANVDTASFGQLWVKNDTPNTLWFTDDAGTDWQLNTSGSSLPTGTTTSSTLRWDGAAWSENTTVKADTSGSLFLTERGTAAASTAGVGQYWVRNVSPNTPRFTDDAGSDFAIVMAGTTNGNTPYLYSYASSTTVPAFYGRQANSSGPYARFFQSGFSTGTDGTSKVELGPSGNVYLTGVLFVQERAAAQADVAGRGQIWVKSDTPNTLWFTDDAGTDWQLGTGLTSPVGATDGGTGQTTYATGDIIYASAANTLSKLAAGTNGHVLTLAAGVPSWAAASGGAASETKYKTVIETVISSTTLQNDDHLAGFSFDANSYYKVEGYISASAASTTPDIKFSWSFTNAPQESSWMLHGVTSAGASSAGDWGGMTATITCQLAATSQGFTVSGYVRTNATTGGTATLQWAQNTSNASDVDVNPGSWITFTKIS